VGGFRLSGSEETETVKGEKDVVWKGMAEQKMVAENQIADLTEGQWVGTLAGIGLLSLGVRDH
jgi:hypothetical protein